MKRGPLGKNVNEMKKNKSKSKQNILFYTFSVQTTCVVEFKDKMKGEKTDAPMNIYHTMSPSSKFASVARPKRIKQILELDLSN